MRAAPFVGTPESTVSQRIAAVCASSSANVVFVAFVLACSSSSMRRSSARPLNQPNSCCSRRQFPSGLGILPAMLEPSSSSSKRVCAAASASGSRFNRKLTKTYRTTTQQRAQHGQTAAGQRKRGRQGCCRQGCCRRGCCSFLAFFLYFLRLPQVFLGLEILRAIPILS